MWNCSKDQVTCVISLFSTQTRHQEKKKKLTHTKKQKENLSQSVPTEFKSWLSYDLRKCQATLLRH